ncbi:senescence-associated protein-domain-containing protein [Pilobolus umbonatus]|nr:senescence-associated protein-domain-containing protein [Pilobolus umbonatus]
MRHTLATVNPVSGKVTKVVANNVHLDREDEEGLLDEQDFMSSLDNEEGHKLPVYMDQNATGNTDPSDIRKVRLLYNSGNALIAGSDWIAQALIFAGKSLARGISSGTQAIDSRLEPNQEPVKLSDEEKRIIEAVYNTTSTVTHLTSGLVDKAVSVAVSGINSMAYDSREMGAREPVENASRHLGVSALQAAVRIVSGAATAATAILASSRDSVVKIVHKKYGEDAKFIAERTLGAASNVADTLVYFDGAGISRRVIMSGVDKFNMDASQSSSRSAEENEVVFENDWLEKENESIDMSYYKSASVDVPFNPNLPVEDDDSQVSDEENVAPEKVETNLDEESVVSEKSVTNPEEVGITSEKIEPSLKEDVVAHQPEKIVNLKEEVVLQESEKMETKPREEVILQEPERVIIPKEEVASHKSEKDKKLDVVHNECEIPKEEHTDAIIQTELVI